MLTVLAFILSNVWLIIIGRTIIGFTSGSQAIAQASIVDIRGQENQARNTGFIILAVTLGAIMGPAYGQVFSDSKVFYLFNNQTPFIGAALLSLVAMLILLFFYHDVHQPNHKSVKFTRVIDIFRDAVTHPQIRVLLLSMIGVFGCWSIYYTYMTIYLVKTLNATSGNISVFMSMYGVGASIAMALLGSIVEKWLTTKQAVVAGWSLLALSTLLTQFSTSLNIDFILAIFAGIGVGVGMLFTMKAFSVQVSSEQQGWIMGVFNASWVGVMGVSVMITGYIASFGIMVPLIIGYIFFISGITLFIRRVTV